jgi:translation initiation factor IF-1
MIKIVDDFLDFSQNYYELCKKLKYYNGDEFLKKTGTFNNFPGYRTNFLDIDYPFLYYAVLANIKNKFELDLDSYRRISGHAQMRLDNSKDWIHRDWGDTVLVYLSPTNEKSGTAFYEIIGDDGKDFIYRQTAMVNFIHNRGVFFTEGTQHMAINTHGTSPEDARLTLTYFLHKKP